MPSPSSPPTRIPLPRHLAQLSGPERSDTGTFSASAVSPQGSADYSRMNDTPEATFHDTSSVSSPTETKIVDPSMIAVHGSVPPSPILRAQRAGKLGKESSTFPPPRDTPEWNNEKAQDDLADQNPDAPPIQAGETAEAEAETTSSAVDIKRTANNSRVIAIDLEVIYPQHPPDNIQPIFGADIQLMEQSAISQVFSPVSPVSPTEMKGTTSGLLLAFKQLRALGHPLHLISTREAREKAEIEIWLEQQGIGIGTADEDVVAALWFTDAVLPMTEAVRFATLSGGRDRMGEAKLKVLRAINAALLITTHQGFSRAIDSAFPSISTIQLIAKSHAQFRNADLAPVVSDISSHGDHTRVERWGDVVAYVKAWDEAK